MRRSSHSLVIRRRLRNNTFPFESFWQHNKKSKGGATQQVAGTNTTPDTSSPSNPHPFDFMWKRWGMSSDWQDQLHKSAAHKSLDIPEDGVIKTSSKDTVNNGMGFKEILALGTVGALGLGGVYALSNHNQTPPVQPPASVAPLNPVQAVVTQPVPVVPPAVAPVGPVYPGPPDSSYDVFFFDKDGNQISVPRLPNSLRK